MVLSTRTQTPFVVDRSDTTRLRRAYRASCDTRVAREYAWNEKKYEGRLQEFRWCNDILRLRTSIDRNRQFRLALFRIRERFQASQSNKKIRNAKSRETKVVC